MIRAVLSDVEGTTTALSFVRDTLFPYAADHLPDYLRRGAARPEIAALLDETAVLAHHAPDVETCIATLLDWMRQDRKLAPLKALQGLIWEAGYRSGAYQGHVYPDVPPMLQSWHQMGVALHIFSSGSVSAQQLLFRYSIAGDLSRWIAGHFDTRTGAKRDPQAYFAISQRIGLPAAQILFLSDTAEELDAAAEAGMASCQLVRGGKRPSGRHACVGRFDEIPALDQLA